MRSFTQAAIPVTMALLAAGCQSTGKTSAPPNDLSPKPVPGPIWRASKTPEPLSPVELVPGESRRVSLVGSAAKPFRRVSHARLSSPLPLEITTEDTALLLTAGKAGGGDALVTVELEGEGAQSVTFPVSIKPLPIVKFQYTAPEGRSPAKVAVAGDFNGWNQGKDFLTRGTDGVYRGEIAVTPGVWNYKLVVDGEWMADPGNPRHDSSGYGNSVLEVAGEAAKTFHFRMLSSTMPGAGPQGGLFADLPAGVGLDAKSVTVLVNNQPVAPGATIAGNRVSLAVPADAWDAENFVVVTAGATDGSTGRWSGLFTTASAPRSPRDEVIYYAMTDRFADGDAARNKPSTTEGVHPLANYVGGDWAGIRQKIEEGYFDNLGVTTIWLSPVVQNTQKTEKESVPPFGLYTSYHGYWPTSDTETNEQFGSMDDLRELVRTAHAHGIAVLFDFVAAHVHSDHPLAQQHPEWIIPYKTPDGRDNLRLFDEFPLTTWFDTFLPKLNYDNNPALVQQRVDNAMYWLNETGADGFRHDAVKHIPTVFWRELTARIRRDFNEKQGRFVYQVGETISGYGTINEYVGPDLLTGQFDFPLYFALQGILARGEGSMADLGAAALRSQENYPAGAIMSPLLGNHDVIRFMGYADGDIPKDIPEKEIGFKRPPHVDDPRSYDKIKLAFAFLTSLPGPPTIYYGDEIGLTGAHDPDNRRPMPWKWDASQSANYDAVSALNRARHGSIALRRGRLEVLQSDGERLVLARIAPEQTVIVALQRNAVDGDWTVEIPAAWGTPKELRPLVDGRAGAGLEGGVLRLSGGAYAFGAWEVGW